MKTEREGERGGQSVRPPKVAETILRLILPARYRDQQLGDLCEAFESLLERAGSSKAKRWYWLQTLRSACPNMMLRLRSRGRAPRRGNGRGRNPGMELLQDLRYAARSLKREPAFFSVVLLLFALSIGASTIVFSVVDAVVVRQLPYADSERIVGVSETFSYPGYKDWLDMNNAFEAIGIYRTDRYAVTGQREPELITGAAVTHGVFAALRTDPILGRTILPGDDEIGGPQLAVLSDGLWKRRFGSDSTVLGRSIQLNEEHHTIVGVMPPGFKFPNDVQLWATFSDERRQGARDWSFAHALARLKSGTTIDGAQREMEILAARLEESMPPDSRSRKPEFRVVRFKEMVVGEVRSAMFLLLGAVGAALLISCVNIANLLLVKAVERSREVAIRVSIGAARWWLVSSHPETGNMERCEA